MDFPVSDFQAWASAFTNIVTVTALAILPLWLPLWRQHRLDSARNRPWFQLRHKCIRETEMGAGPHERTCSIYPAEFSAVGRSDVCSAVCWTIHLRYYHAPALRTLCIFPIAGLECHIPSLWIPWVPIWDSIVSPVEFLSIILRIQRAELQPCIPVDYVRLYLLLALMVCLSAIAALAIGWVLQCAVAIVRATRFSHRL